MVSVEQLNEFVTKIEESNRKSILELNNQQTKDIKDHIKNEITELKQKFEEELNRKSIEFENKYKDLRVKYEKLERELKKNNIIIFGLTAPVDNLEEFIRDSLNNLLGIKLLPGDISNAYSIGKQKEKRPIIVKLVTYFKKQEILKKLKKLKNTGVSIAQELSLEEQRENKILRQSLKKARSKNLNAFIKNNKLIINGESYTASQLAVEEENSEPETETKVSKLTENHPYQEKIEPQIEPLVVRTSNSAPATPTLIPELLTSESEEDQREEEVFVTKKVEELQKRKIKGAKQTASKVGKPVTRLNSVNRTPISKNNTKKT